MIFLNNMSLDIVKLLVEFIYKGDIKMPESQIEHFLDAGRSLQIEGVAGNNESVNLEDRHEMSSKNRTGVLEEEEEEERDEGVMNSTENFDCVESLRDAGPLSSFLDVSRISGDIERTVRQDLTVNIRRMSKEDERLYLSSCSGLQHTNPLQQEQEEDGDIEMLDPPDLDVSRNTSTINKRRSRRSVRRSAGGKDGGDGDILECEVVNASHNSRKNRRSSRQEDKDYVCNRSRNSENIKQNKSRRSERLRNYDNCPERRVSSEMADHIRASHPERSTHTSILDQSRNSSFINLGSLYRTRPMESRRSLMEKTTSDFSRVKSVSKSSNNRIRSEMLRTLETHPPETRASVAYTQIASYADPLDNLPSQGISPHADNLPSQGISSSADNLPSQGIFSFADNLPSQGISSLADDIPSQGISSGTDDIPGLDSGEGQQGTATVSQPPDVPQADTAATSLVSGEGEGGESHSAVSDLVMANVVEMSGRKMCRLCGMQVTLYYSLLYIHRVNSQVRDSQPERHFQRKHGDLL